VLEDLGRLVTKSTFEKGGAKNAKVENKKAFVLAPPFPKRWKRWTKVENKLVII
jgi:hypothetical protein